MQMTMSADIGAQRPCITPVRDNCWGSAEFFHLTASSFGAIMKDVPIHIASFQSSWLQNWPADSSESSLIVLNP